jgi:hypothetical protein
LAGVATGTAGFFQPQYDSKGNLIPGSSNYDAFTSGLSTLGNKLGLSNPFASTDDSGIVSGNGTMQPTDNELNFLKGSGANDQSYFDYYGNVIGDGE